MKCPLPYSSHPAESLGVSGGMKNQWGPLWLVGLCNKPPRLSSFPSSSLKLFPAELTNPMCWDSTAGGYTRCCLGWGLQRGRANRAQGFGLRLFRICNLPGDTSRAEKRICSQLQGVAEDWLSRLLCCIDLHTVLKQRIQAAAYKPAS